MDQPAVYPVDFPKSLWDRIAEVIASNVEFNQATLHGLLREVHDLNFSEIASDLEATTGERDQLAKRVTELQAALDQARIRGGTMSLKMPDPPLFSGKDRKELRPFIAHLRMKIAQDAERLPDEQSRLRYALSRLEGIAFAQLLPHVQGSMVNLPDVTAVIKLLETAFGDPDRVATAFRELASLKQKDREFSLYLADFQRISADLDMNEQTKIESLRSGISPELKDLLMAVLDVPEDFDGYIKACQKLDNRLVARRREKKGEDHRFSRATMSAPV